jgi:hypothetical protein
MNGNKTLETRGKIPAAAKWVLILSLLLFFFALPHTLEDFALGEPASHGVPAPLLAFLVASLFALQGLALFWLGQQKRRSYFLHAGLGIAWALAAGMEQLPVILASESYRAGWISVLYVAGMILIGILLFLASLQALRRSGHLLQGNNEHAW